MRKFEIRTPFQPAGDQPGAIRALTDGLRDGKSHQVLLGVTGSGKTFTMAKVIEALNRPALVIAHNKTLAAQLFGEFRGLFPKNAVEYFVSYYDYYQPEAYIPKTDTFIEKDAMRNDRIDRMRLSATKSLLERRDVIIVASVSCIYGLGSPESYHGMVARLAKGQTIEREEILRQLTAIQYRRNEIGFGRGDFRVRGDVIDVHPADQESQAIRVELFGDEVESITEFDPLTGEVLTSRDEVSIYPKTHYVAPEDAVARAVETIEAEKVEHLRKLRASGSLVEAQRLEQRTNYDLELLREVGVCPGIENYSRHLTGRVEGEPPPTLLDYFPEKSLILIDESHATVPQIGAMYKGDRSRKETLVKFGFRLPSALDNRPLRFDEFQESAHRAGRQMIYVSATPAQYELDKSGGARVEQIVRPTGLLDPEIDVRPAQNQVKDLLGEIRKTVKMGDRVLVTTLTKRMAEDLTDHYLEEDVRVKYLHSDIDTIERTEILRELRSGVFDVLVGINLLREGLDMPEVSLVAILDADKEGFLRSERSLIQTCGRASRNLRGRVILYADRMTASMEAAISETDRRRKLQEAYNRKNNITPRSIQKGIGDSLGAIYDSDYTTIELDDTVKDSIRKVRDIPAAIVERTRMMNEAAKEMKYEKAAEYRDEIRALERLELGHR
ncbi:MAG: excinuclease ABC subunit UvrB [Planctomycetota bacterium]|nr:excinuclease ABC subunit UvrB [Planctomycetota bacterium]